MLVGTKCDLKEDKKALEELRKASGPEATPVSKEEGDALARQIKAYAYFETSAKENIGVTEALNAVLEAAEVEDEMRPTCICLWVSGHRRDDGAIPLFILHFKNFTMVVSEPVFSDF